MLVEVAYCSTPTEYRSKQAPFPETPEGQKEFLDAVNSIVLQTPDNLGRGIFWWEPATPPGGTGSRDFFDEEGNVLPVITVFDKFTRHQEFNLVSQDFNLQNHFQYLTPASLTSCFWSSDRFFQLLCKPDSYYTRFPTAEPGICGSNSMSSDRH